MDLKGSLIDTKLKIYPSEKFIDFIKTIQEIDVPKNFLILRDAKKGLEDLVKSESQEKEEKIHLSNKDLDILKIIKEEVKHLKSDKAEFEECSESISSNDETSSKGDAIKENFEESNEKTTGASTENLNKIIPEREGPYLTTRDIIWLQSYLNKKRQEDKKVPYLHELLEEADIETPKNSVLKRNPVLEARCVKLRAQQEAREYRKMTKGVDNVRMRFPEDSIAYQLKQLNRQLIAIGQFIISIFAGFLFGFKGVEWTIGPLDFGFRLLLGVMCALIIALAEIYFLAKKLNEELSVPETTQLGGPPKFVDTKTYDFEPRAAANKNVASQDKEHQD